ncbi:hypothetical protein KBC40_00250 [Patescibacteria group bacterium]|jgi:CxxC-x17-CxxC domain-containing protein|nr:hypothetical protein [Patescibacteria group bacterium]
MGNFNRDRRPGGDRGGASRGFGGGGGRDRGFGGGRSFGGGRDRDRGPVEMHSAVCDGCGNDCEVPFRPSSGKPVYCNDCFKNNDSRPQRDNRSSDRGQGNDQLKETLSAVNKKLDQILDLLAPKTTSSKAKAKDLEVMFEDAEVEVKPKAVKKTTKKDEAVKTVKKVVKKKK